LHGALAGQVVATWFSQDVSGFALVQLMVAAIKSARQSLLDAVSIADRGVELGTEPGKTGTVRLQD
jgi:hypothetical protein